MAKTFAFDPPSAANKDTPSGPISRIGHGQYMADIGMRRMDVDKRTRMHGQTGRGYLETVAAYEARRKQNKTKPDRSDTYQDVRGNRKPLDKRGWPHGTEKWEDK